MVKIASSPFMSKQMEKHLLVKQKEPCEFAESFDMEIREKRRLIEAVLTSFKCNSLVREVSIQYKIHA